MKKPGILGNTDASTMRKCFVPWTSKLLDAEYFTPLFDIIMQLGRFQRSERLNLVFCARIAFRDSIHEPGWYGRLMDGVLQPNHPHVLPVVTTQQEMLIWLADTRILCVNGWEYFLQHPPFKV